MNQHQFVFIGGLHRSGTSILFKCLKDHPQISGFDNTGVPEDEGQHLQSVFEPAKLYGGSGRFGFNRASFLDETSALVSHEYAKRIFAEWQPYWELEKPVLLEKSPPNLVRSRFLQALFPNSHFVILLRHPIATAYATKKWRSRMPVHKLVEHWLICHERFDQDREYLRSLIVLQYESFVAEPEKTLNDIYTLLGVEHRPLTREIYPHINDRYFAQWKSLEQGLLSRLYSRYTIKRFEARANRFGYSLQNLEWLRPKTKALHLATLYTQNDHSLV